VSAIQSGFAGPKDSRGNQVYPGFFFDTGITASGGGIPGLLASGSSPLGPPNTSVDQDVDKEVAAALSSVAPQIGDSSSWTNLSTFFGHGSKLIFYHGVSDPWFWAKDTIDYYERKAAANGGEDKVMESSRLFLSPGMGHCGGGSAAFDSFDMLTAISNWVERGVAPASVSRHGPGLPRGAVARSARTRHTRSTKARAIRRTPRTTSASAEREAALPLRTIPTRRLLHWSAAGLLTAFDSAPGMR
jgi:hypothetical protein